MVLYSTNVSELAKPVNPVAVSKKRKKADPKKPEVEEPKQEEEKESERVPWIHQGPRESTHVLMVLHPLHPV